MIDRRMIVFVISVFGVPENQVPNWVCNFLGLFGIMLFVSLGLFCSCSAFGCLLAIVIDLWGTSLWHLLCVLWVSIPETVLFHSSFPCGLSRFLQASVVFSIRLCSKTLWNLRLFLSETGQVSVWDEYNLKYSRPLFFGTPKTEITRRTILAYGLRRRNEFPCETVYFEDSGKEEENTFFHSEGKQKNPLAVWKYPGRQKSPARSWDLQNVALSRRSHIAQEGNGTEMLAKQRQSSRPNGLQNKIMKAPSENEC